MLWPLLLEWLSRLLLWTKMGGGEDRGDAVATAVGTGSGLASADLLTTLLLWFAGWCLFDFSIWVLFARLGSLPRPSRAFPQGF